LWIVAGSRRGEEASEDKSSACFKIRLICAVYAGNVRISSSQALPSFYVGRRLTRAVIGSNDFLNETGRRPESPIRVPETQSNISSARTTKRFPSPRCASTIQIVRPSHFKADTQPQAPSGFAEIVSDDFPKLHAADSACFTLLKAMKK
jgi:hypothetical protein